MTPSPLPAIAAPTNARLAATRHAASNPAQLIVETDQPPPLGETLVSGAGGHEPHVIAAQHHPVADYQTGVPTVTRLVLRSGAADFRQVDKGRTVYDSGTISCTPAR